MKIYLNVGGYDIAITKCIKCDYCGKTNQTFLQLKVDNEEILVCDGRILRVFDKILKGK